MKKIFQLAFLTCFLCTASAIAAKAKFSEELGAALHRLKELRVASNQAFDSDYPGTQCFDLALAGTDERIGFFCHSRNSQFIQDMGIMRFESLPEAARPKIRPLSGLVVSTPMGQYGMHPMPGTRGEVAEATVDCDTDAGPVYRATATCNVAITSPPGQEVLYSNFVATDHTTGRVGLTRARIQEVWRRIHPN